MLTANPLPLGDRTHWNYFLALENDLIGSSRYVEFALANKSAYSIEFAQILMTAASEVDVLAKLIVEKVDPHAPRKNIDNYRDAIVKGLPDFADYEVAIPRYGLKVEPWAAWKSGTNPNWWRSYNDVKHERDQFFADATLENAVSAVAGLLVAAVQYYRLKLAPPGQFQNKMQATTSYLSPESSLLFLNGDFYSKLLSFSSE